MCNSEPNVIEINITLNFYIADTDNTVYIYCGVEKPLQECVNTKK